MTKVKFRSIAVEMIADDLLAVVAIDAQGRSYTHNHHFDVAADRAAVTKAFRLRNQVAEAGAFDPALWDCYIPYGSDAWDIDGMEVTLMDDFERRQKEGMFF